MSPDPVFVIGAQRSGTTLLRLLLNAGQNISIPEEGTFLMPLLRRTRSVSSVLRSREIETFFDYLDGNSQFKLWDISTESLRSKFAGVREITVKELIGSLYEAYAHKENKERWGDKTPSFFRMIPVLAMLFPTARFVHIVRDGRDLYLSWRKMDPTKYNPAVTALEWSYKLRKARRDMEKYAAGRFVEIRYEDLVLEPESTLKTVCQFCRLTYDSNMLDYWLGAHKYIGEHHSDLIFTGISRGSIEKWKGLKGRDKSLIKYFEIVAFDALVSSGYVVLSEGKKLNDKAMVIALIAIGLPRRIYQVMRTKLLLNISMKYGRATTLSGGHPENNS